MNKKLRSIIMSFSLLAMILASFMTNARVASAQDTNNEIIKNQAPDMVWQASPENAKEFVELVEQMGSQVEFIDGKTDSKHTAPIILDETISAQELAGWVKVQSAATGGDQAQARIIIIRITVTPDYILIEIWIIR